MLTQHMQKLAHSEDGSVLPLVGVASIVLIGSMGLAIDSGRAQLVRSKLMSSADAAALAVGARLGATDLDAEAAKFVHANFPAGYAGGTVTSVDAEANDDESVITVSASATMQTTLMSVLGFGEVTVSVTSEVTRDVTGLELALVLDNTGSMLTDNKIGSLKTAATDLVNILYGSDGVANNLYVGIVPFSQAVNIGPTRSNWLVAGSLAARDWGTTTWAGCVEARSATSRDTTDDPYTSQAFIPYYWPDNNYSSYYNSSIGNNWITYSGGGDDDDDDDDSGTPTYNITASTGPNKFCPQPITPLTSSKATVLAGIQSMNAVGLTHINTGAVWGWRLLSPRWRDMWGGEMDQEDLPLDYNTPQMNKVMVLMSDGDNTFYDGYFTDYRFLSNNRLGTTSSTTAASRLNTRTTTVCTAMKNAGITIYTIAFGTELSTTGRNLLRGCATQPDYYFYSPNAADLQTAFNTIGDSLSKLRVSR